MWMNSIATRKTSDNELNIRSALDCFTFLRGITSVARFAKPWLPTGKLGPMLRFGFFGPILQAKRRRGETIDTPTEANEQLNRLQSLIDLIDDKEKLLLYRNVVNNLQESFSNYYALSKDNCSLSVVLQWPSLLSDEYINLLMSCDPEALVIFAHFAVLLSKALPCWWLEGRAEWILASVHSHLEEYYRPWLQWPREELGWVPE